MDKLNKLSYSTIKQLLVKKEISAIELTSIYIKTSRKLNKKYNAYKEITEECALNQAGIAQQRINKKKTLKIEAMPVGVKDNFCTKDILTTACSQILKNFTPSYESSITNKIFLSGGVMIGKTNMDEFAMGSFNTNSYFGNTVNPYKAINSNEELVSGGSSGGSAVAVAAGMCLSATGTDTGGSIRLPAAFTGTIGVKPTYGRCSRFGIIAFASSLDQAGIFSCNIIDSILILESIIGFDKKDSTSTNINSPNILSSIKANVKGLKVGVVHEYKTNNISFCIKNYLEKSKQWLINSGAKIINISLPHTKYALATYYIIAMAESSSNLARYDGVKYGARKEKKNDSFKEMISRTRNECFGEEVKRRIISGSYVLSSGHFGEYYQKAQKVRRLIMNDFKIAFHKIDVILAPTTVDTAFPIKNKLNPVEMYNNDLFTIPASLSGLPCVSIPVGFSNNKLPVGIQLIANSYDEKNLFKFASIISNNAKFQKMI